MTPVLLAVGLAAVLGGLVVDIRRCRGDGLVAALSVVAAVAGLAAIVLVARADPHTATAVEASIALRLSCSVVAWWRMRTPA